MHYKTTVLELLQQRPQMHQQLQQQRKLLTTMEAYAKELKASHEAWKEQLAEAKPGSEASQISSEAFEMALRELEDRLPPASRADDHDSLDQAMAFIRNPSSRG
jgi:chromosome segregation ATPase